MSETSPETTPNELRAKMLAVLAQRAEEGDSKAAMEVLKRLDEERAAEPTQAEVLAWVADVPGRGGADAVSKFWPQAVGKERDKLRNRVRQWMWRAGITTGKRETQTADQPPGDDEPGPSTPDLDGARLPRVQILERQLGDLLATTKALQGLPPKDRGALGTLSRQVTALSAELEAERKRSGAIVLDRSPAAVAAEVLRRHQALAVLADAHERLQATDEEGT